jgi:hypothetical protein
MKPITTWQKIRNCIGDMDISCLEDIDKMTDEILNAIEPSQEELNEHYEATRRQH